MATAKSDDDSDVSSHPLAENRPGVYVQVAAGRKRKKARRADGDESSPPPKAAPATASEDSTGAEAQASLREQDQAIGAPEKAEVPAPLPAESADASAAASGPVGDEPEPRVATSADADDVLLARGPARFDDEEDTGRESGERPVDFESKRPLSENTNHRADLMGVNIPPPPRVPSFAHAEREIDTDPAPALHSASLLDAPHSLRPGPDSVAATRPSFVMFAAVAVFSAIIVSAGIVALRELTRDDDVREARSAQASTGREQARPEAPHDARPRVEQLVPSAAGQAVPQPTFEVASPARAAVRAPNGRAANVQRAPIARGPQATARAVPARVPVLPAPAKSAAPATGEQPAAPEAESDQEPLPEPDEPLELPYNPYR